MPLWSFNSGDAHAGAFSGSIVREYVMSKKCPDAETQAVDFVSATRAFGEPQELIYLATHALRYCDSAVSLYQFKVLGQRYNLGKITRGPSTHLPRDFGGQTIQ